MFGFEDPVTRVTKRLVRGAAENAAGVVLRATHALGRELAAGFLEREPEIRESVREVAGTVGASVTRSAVEEVSAQAERQLEESPPRPLEASARRLGRAVATGATEGIVTRGLWRIALPFGAGVLATVVFQRSLSRPATDSPRDAER